MCGGEAAVVVKVLFSESQLTVEALGGVKKPSQRN